jgi:hypothetical protein
MSGKAALRRDDRPDQELTVEVVERRDTAGVWTVEAIGSDGEIYQAIFPGPDSEDRAREYARMKYDA